MSGICQPLHMRKLAIVGAGKVGSVLGKVFVERGGEVVCVVSRTETSARRGGRFLKCRRTSTSLAAIPPETDVIYVTTPHAAIERVAEGLAQVGHLRFGKLAVCHASGMLTAHVLRAVELRGATVFSFHPLQTFPRDFPPKDIVPAARGIYYGIDGSRRALGVAQRLARNLGGKTILIQPNLRPLYHAACVLASNHVTTMMGILQGMFRALGTDEKEFYPVFKPIIMATLRNVEMTSPEEALSGPVARGGVETVDEHFKAIARTHPEALPYFCTLTKETVRLAAAKGSITPEQEQELMDVIHRYSLRESA